MLLAQFPALFRRGHDVHVGARLVAVYEQLGRRDPEAPALIARNEATLYELREFGIWIFGVRCLAVAVETLG